MLNKKSGRDRDAQFSTGQKSGDGDRDFLQEDGEERPNKSEEEREAERQKRRWFMNQLRSKLDSGGETDGGDTQPKQSSPEEENDYADERTNDWNRKVHGDDSDQDDKSRLNSRSSCLISK